NTTLNWYDWNKPQQQATDQNVRYGDAHVEFQSNPFTGVQRDNIYARRAPLATSAGTAPHSGSYDANDNVLLPTDGPTNGGTLHGKNTYGGETTIEDGRTAGGKYFRPTDKLGRDLAEGTRSEVELSLGVAVTEVDG